MEQVTIQLSLPKDLYAAVLRQAARSGADLDHFVALALAARLDATETARYFAERGARVDLDSVRRILNRKGGEPPRPDDVIENT